MTKPCSSTPVTTTLVPCGVPCEMGKACCRERNRSRQENGGGQGQGQGQEYGAERHPDEPDANTQGTGQQADQQIGGGCTRQYLARQSPQDPRTAPRIGPANGSGDAGQACGRKNDVGEGDASDVPEYRRRVESTPPPGVGDRVPTYVVVEDVLVPQDGDELDHRKRSDDQDGDDDGASSSLPQLEQVEAGEGNEQWQRRPLESPDQASAAETDLLCGVPVDHEEDDRRRGGDSDRKSPAHGPQTRDSDDGCRHLDEQTLPAVEQKRDRPGQGIDAQQGDRLRVAQEVGERVEIECQQPDETESRGNDDTTELLPRQFRPQGNGHKCSQKRQGQKDILLIEPGQGYEQEGCGQELCSGALPPDLRCRQRSGR